MLTNFKVCVRCMTYNHAHYIEDAMNGFCIQQTDFGFVCVIIDDASTDGEPEVIMKYLHEHFDLNDKTTVRNEETDDYTMIFAQHKENKNCYFVVIFLKYNHYSAKKIKKAYYSTFINHSKYIALCEGDDYWTSPQKLQKQVDFLESHSDFSMCFHSVNILTEDTKRLKKSQFCHITEKEYNGNEIIERWTVPTCSVLYRSAVDEAVPKDKRFCVGDNVLFLTAASYGRCYCMNLEMGCYRRCNDGWISRNYGIAGWIKLIQHMQTLLLYFPQYKKGINKAIARYYVLITIYKIKQGDISFCKQLYKGLKEYPVEYITKSYSLIRNKISKFY